MDTKDQHPSGEFIKMLQANIIGYKQNRENTEGYSKSIVRKNNDKLGKRIGLSKQNICKSQRDGTMCTFKR